MKILALLEFSPKLHNLDTYIFLARIFDKTTETTAFWRHTFKILGLLAFSPKLHFLEPYMLESIFGETTQNRHTLIFLARIFDKTTGTTDFWRHTFENFGLASILA